MGVKAGSFVAGLLSRLVTLACVDSPILIDVAVFRSYSSVFWYRLQSVELLFLICEAILGLCS